jgi:hypothetical protein
MAIKIYPLIRNGKIISIKISFNYRADIGKYRNYIVIHDSLSIMLSSLDKLSKTFLSDYPDLMKLSNKDIIETLISEHKRKQLFSDAGFFSSMEVKKING